MEKPIISKAIANKMKILTGHVAILQPFIKENFNRT